VIELKRGRKDSLGTKLTITTMKTDSDDELLFMEMACILMTGSRSLVTIWRTKRDCRGTVFCQIANS